MTDTVFVALISLFGVIISGVISAIVSNNLIKYRIESLEKKVDEHNGYSKLFAESSKDIALIKQNIEWMKQQLENRNG